MQTKRITGMMVMLALLISVVAISQGKREWNEKKDKGKRHHEYSNNRNYNRYDDRENDRYNNRDYKEYNNPKVIRVRPNYPTHGYVGRPPSYRHVWVPGEYRWRGGEYVFMPGNWMVPPRRGMNYVPGYWQPSRGGYVWVSGFWNNSGISMRR